MAKFFYKMQNILDVKHKLETQAKTAYGIALAKHREEEEKLAELNNRKMQYEIRSKELVTSRLNITEIKTCKDAIETMKGAIRSQLMAVHLAQRNVESARNHLSEIMTERKTHEILKEKAFDEFKYELLVEENRAVDELVSFTYHRSANE